MVLVQRVRQIRAHIPMAVAAATQAQVDQDARDGAVEAVAVLAHVGELEFEARRTPTQPLASRNRCLQRPRA